MAYNGLVGASHHRWIIEMQDKRIQFRMKYHFLHTHRDFYIPPSYKRTMPPEKGISFLFWEDFFEFEEVMGYEFHQESKDFIASLNIPPYYYWLDYLRGFKDRIRRLKYQLSQRVNTSSTQSSSEELWTWDKLFEVNKQYLDSAGMGDLSSSESH